MKNFPPHAPIYKIRCERNHICSQVDMSDEILFAENLNALSRVRHAFFTRPWIKSGFLESQEEQSPLLLKKQVAEYFGVSSEQFLCCRQIHSSTVVTVENVWTNEDAPKADAMVTNMAGIVLGVLTADCVPVLLAATNVAVVGVAHAGWRGALKGVLEHTLEAMEKYGAQRKHIHVAAGPCIWQESYEVGPEFPAPFLAEHRDNERFFIPSKEKGDYQFDLHGYITNKMKELGVGSISPSFANTCVDPDRFFSHRYASKRGEKRKGNLVSAIALRK